MAGARHGAGRPSADGRPSGTAGAARRELHAAERRLAAGARRAAGSGRYRLRTAATSRARRRRSWSTSTRAELRKMDDTIDVPVCADVEGLHRRDAAAARIASRPRDRSAWNARWRDWQTKYPGRPARVPQPAGRREHVRARRGHLRGVGARRRDRLGQLRRRDRDLLPRDDAEGRAAPVSDDRARRDGQRPARRSSAPASRTGDGARSASTATAGCS